MFLCQDAMPDLSPSLVSFLEHQPIKILKIKQKATLKIAKDVLINRNYVRVILQNL